MEKAKLVVSILQLIATASIAVIVHLWSISNATQLALVEIKEQTRMIGFELQKDMDRDKKAWSIAEINEIAGKSKNDVKGNIISLLNEYESLAAGVNANVYNKELIKVSRKNALMATCKKYISFINDRRESTDPDAWKQLTLLAEEWGGCTQG